jgi:filamentous hemagglutinin family protein
MFLLLCCLKMAVISVRKIYFANVPTIHSHHYLARTDNTRIAGDNRLLESCPSLFYLPCLLLLLVCGQAQAGLGGGGTPADTTPPIVSISVEGGAYNFAPSISLTTNELAIIYYTLDGSIPTNASPVYSISVEIYQSATLKYFAVDTAGNASAVLSQTYAITYLPPTAPSFFSTRFITPTQIGFTWSNAIDNTGVTEYQVYRNGIMVGTTPVMTFTDAGLTASTLYSYTVAACNGEGNCSAQSAPKAITTLAETASMVVTPQVAVGGMHTVAIKADGTLWAWGNSFYGQLGDGSTVAEYSRSSPVQIGTGYIAVAAGYYHTIALKADGSLWTWGGNYAGQLGIGTSDYLIHSTPIQIATGFTSVATSYDSNVAIKADGSLWAWGWSPNQHSSPMQIGKGFASVAAGINHTLAVKSDGRLWAWGDNSYGQIGDGTTIYRSGPIQVGNGVASVQAGGNHTVAIKVDGSLWAWGSNSKGQIGDGTIVDRWSPTQLGSGFAAIAAGGDHTAAIKADGSLWAWGGNSGNALQGQGQIGDGTTIDRWNPVQIDTGYILIDTGYILVAASSSHTAGIKVDGSLWAWGGNGNGQIGDGTTTDRLSPVLIGTDFVPITPTTLSSEHLPLDGVVTSGTASITTSGATMTITNSAGAVINWSDFDIGTNATVNFVQPSADSTVVIQVAIANPSQILGTLQSNGRVLIYSPAGIYFGMGSKVNVASLSAWARQAIDTVNFLSAGIRVGGTSMVSAITTPGLVVTFSSDTPSVCTVNGNIVTAIAAGICTIAANHPSDAFNSAIRATQSIIVNTVSPFFTPSTTLSASSSHTMALKADGSLWAWGVNGDGQLGDGSNTNRISPVLIGSNFSAVSAGDRYTIAVKADGSLWAWGNNNFGQLGDGTTTSRNAPVQIGSDYSSTLTTFGGYGNSYTLALKTDGSLWAWGNNSFGKLGDGTTTNRNMPVSIGTGFRTMTQASEYVLALKTDGSLWEWGYLEPSPVQVDGVFNSMALGGSSRFAIKSDGSLWAWGDNSSGQLGDGTTTSQSTPEQIAGSYGAVITTGSSTFALKLDGSLWAWGYNGFGQLGDGTTTQRLIPVQIGSGFNAVTSGGNGTQTFALKPDGSLWAWGDNGSNTLGDGTGTSQSTPVQIGIHFSGFATASNRTFGLGSDGSLWGWGFNFWGQLGDGTTTNQALPVQITGLGLPFDLTLHAGWNLLGNSFSQAISVSTLFGDATAVNTVWKWNSALSQWQFYTPALDSTALQSYASEKGYVVFSAINPGEGFWVNATKAQTLPSPSPLPFNLSVANLLTGWNLVATGNRVTPTIFNSSFSAQPPVGTSPKHLTSLWAWSNPDSRWYFYSPSLEYNGTLYNYTSAKAYLPFPGDMTLAKAAGFWVNLSPAAPAFIPHFAYVADLGSNAISMYTVDVATGKLQSWSSPTAVASPTFVAIDPTGNLLYAANGGSNRISIFSIDPSTGTLIGYSPIYAGQHPRSIVFDPSGKFAYVTNSDSNDISAFILNISGGITPAPLPCGGGVGCNGNNFVAGTFPIAFAVAANGKFAYAVNNSSSDISAYSVDTVSGALTAIPCGMGSVCHGNNFSTGTNPYSISIDPSSQYAYVVNSNSNSVSAFAINASTGALVPVACGSGAGCSGGNFASGNFPIHVDVDPTGKFVYVVNNSSNDISAYAINTGTGALTLIPCVGSAGCSGNNYATGTLPYSFTIDPSGKFAYVPNQGSNDVTSYSINAETGALVSIETVPAGTSPLSIAITKALAP